MDPRAPALEPQVEAAEGESAFPFVPAVKKAGMVELAGRYLEALRGRLNGDKAPTRSAAGLGRDALALGLGTLDLARIHEKALRVLTPANCSAATLRRIRGQSSPFFLETLTPIESGTRRLRREIVRRQAAEGALRTSQRHYRTLWRESRLMEHRLRHLSHRILSAQEEERKKISRDLHDQIAQMLAGINVHLATFNGAAAISSTSLSRKIRNTQRMVEKSVKMVHRFAQELRPPVLDDLGLIPAFKAYLKNFTERTGVRVHLTVAAGVEELPSEKRLVLYRVAQSALTNVGQHAAATRVTVTVVKVGDVVEMRLHDNGKAFDVAAHMRSRKNKRLGLIGMRERTEMVGGTFSIESVSGQGTAITVRIPFGGGRKGAAA